jgi:hypothetical protein
MLNSFKIHDENASPSHKPANTLQKKPLSSNSSSSSSSSSVLLKNQKLGLAPRKALGDISVNKLNARAVQSDIENVVGPIKPANSILGDCKPVSKAPSFKIVETIHLNQQGPVMKASSSTNQLVGVDDTIDTIVSY